MRRRCRLEIISWVDFCYVGEDVRGRKASEVILMLKPYTSGKIIG